MPPPQLSPRRLNRLHPLLSGITNLWIPCGVLAGGGKMWDIVGSGFSATEGSLTNGPTWRNTAWGPGVETGVAATNAYIDLAGFTLSHGLSVFVAYTYRFDSQVNETGILFSAGQNGLELRHGSGGALSFLKSKVASILTSTIAGNKGDFHTAGFSVGLGVTATFQLFFDGQQVATTTSSQTFTGTAPTSFGFSNGSPAEFGRHTILGGALWNGPALNADRAYDWHNAARQQFAPLFKKRHPFFKNTTATVSPWDPSMLPLGRPFQRQAGQQPAKNQSPPAWLLSGGSVPSPSDWLPMFARPSGFVARQIQQAPKPAILLPTTFLFDPQTKPIPPGGLTKVKAQPFLRRLPKESAERRLSRITDQLSAMWNSLVRQGQLVQTGQADFTIHSASHVDNRDPGAFDDFTEGYTIGALWTNQLTLNVFICASNAAGAAVWKQIS